MQHIIDDVDAVLARCGIREPDRTFAFVDGLGSVLRMTVAPPNEIVIVNTILIALGSDRRWMEVAPLAKSEMDA